MNAKQVFTAAAIAFATSGAFATEVTQFTDLGGSLTRAEVKAELAAALADGQVQGPSALYGSFDAIDNGMRDRAAVRAEARMAARDTRFDAQYHGA